MSQEGKGSRKFINYVEWPGIVREKRQEGRALRLSPHPGREEKGSRV